MVSWKQFRFCVPTRPWHVVWGYRRLANMPYHSFCVSIGVRRAESKSLSILSKFSFEPGSASENRKTRSPRNTKTPQKSLVKEVDSNSKLSPNQMPTSLLGSFPGKKMPLKLPSWRESLDFTLFFVWRPAFYDSSKSSLPTIPFVQVTVRSSSSKPATGWHFHVATLVKKPVDAEMVKWLRWRERNDLPNCESEGPLFVFSKFPLVKWPLCFKFLPDIKPKKTPWSSVNCKWIHSQSYQKKNSFQEPSSRSDPFSSPF